LQQGFDPALIVHYVQDISSHVQLVFSAVDDASAIADAIDAAFQAVLGGIHQYDNDDFLNWNAGSDSLDPRCHIDDAFAHADRLEQFSLFGAG
jgi:hypothetical protein